MVRCISLSSIKFQHAVARLLGQRPLFINFFFSFIGNHANFSRFPQVPLSASFFLVHKRPCQLYCFVCLDVAPCKGIWIPENEKFWLVELGIQENFFTESGILGFGIQNETQGIRNPTNDWNPEFKFYWHLMGSSTWNPESTESKTVLDSLTWCDWWLLWKVWTQESFQK